MNLLSIVSVLCVWVSFVSLSEFIHTSLVLLLSRVSFLHGPVFLLEFELLLGNGDLSSFAHVREIFQKLLNTARKQIRVLVALLSQHLSCLRALPLIIHIADNQLVGLVSESVKFGDWTVTRNVCRWEINGLLDVPELVLVSIAEIQKQKGRVSSQTKHICGVRYRRRLWDTSAVRIHRLCVFDLFSSRVVYWVHLGGRNVRLGPRKSWSCHLASTNIHLSHLGANLTDTVPNLEPILHANLASLLVQLIDGFFDHLFAE